MTKSDLALEDQVTIRKSKDPSVIMTANGTTHTTEEATVHVYDLDVFVQFQWLKESLAELSVWKDCARRAVFRMNGIQVSHHISSTVGETSNVKTTTSSSWLSQVCKQPNTRPTLWTTTSTHQRRVDTDLTEWPQPFTDGLTQGSSSSTDVSPASSFRASSSETNFAQVREEAQFMHSFSERPELRRMQTHESYESATQKTSWRSGGQK